jgi:hypothetical protein
MAILNPRSRSPELTMIAPNAIATDKRAAAEDCARLAMEARLGRRLSDPDWASYRSRLVAFFQLLRSWERDSSP